MTKTTRKPPADEKCQMPYCSNYASDVDDCLYVTRDSGWVCAHCLPEIEFEENDGTCSVQVNVND